MPAGLLIFNVIVTGIYAIGVLAAYFASVLDPTSRARRSASPASSTAIGTIAFTLFVDPTSAIITDQAVKGERTVEEVQSMVFYLSLTAIVGTLLSQVILYPAALFIEVARVVNLLH